MQTRFASAITCGLLLLSGCAGHQQSVVDAAGPQSGRTETLWWFFFWVLGIIFSIVMVLTLLTLMPERPGVEQERVKATDKAPEQSDSRLGRLVTGATITTIVILLVLLIASVTTGKANSELKNKANPLTIQVIGNQWWWGIQYMSDDPSQSLVTANEIHIPIGRPVQIRGLSNDVIHSFWVPNLNGKRDLIPSHVTTEWIEADHAGVFRGQCAEFCGLQHAHMGLKVVAESNAKFNSWFQSQLQEAVTPSNAAQQRGQQVFVNNACIYCHQIRGTDAAGQNGPDLTHFGGRLGIAANTVPNTPGNLAGWILDPQSMKPGNHMATIAVNSTDLQPLVEYLESLK